MAYLFEPEMRSINAKILNIEKIYGKDSQIVRRVYATIGRAYGMDVKARFTKIDTLGVKERQKVYMALEAVGKSEYLSGAGRKRIAERARKSFAQYHVAYSSAEKLTQVFDYFQQSNNWARIRELAGEERSDIELDQIMQAQEEYGAEDTEMLTGAYLKQLGTENEVTDLMAFLGNAEKGLAELQEAEPTATMADWLVLQKWN